MSESSQALVTKRAPDRVSTDWDSLNIPCAKKDGASCSLMKHRHDLNKVLRGACLELGEDGRGESRGAVLVECGKARACGYAAYGSEQVSPQARALDLAERLLAEHRCIVAIKFRTIWMARASMRSAINRNRFLKSITICRDILSPRDDHILLETLNPIPQRGRAAIKVNRVEEEWGVDVPMPGRSVGLGMDHLTTLDVSEVQMCRKHSYWLIRELTENESITELAVSQCVFGYRDEASNALFARYLAKEDCALRKLTIKSAIIYGRRLTLRLREIVDAVCNMSTLQELNVDIVVRRGIYMSTVTLFAEVITRSATLRRLRLPSTYCECLTFVPYPYLRFPDPQVVMCIESLRQGLQKPNSTLRRLCIDMRTFFGEAECNAFFRAVADNTTLKTVVVNTLPCIDGLDRVSTTIRELGLNDRVVVKGLCTHDNTRQLQQCPQIGNANINAVIRVCNVSRSIIPSLRVVSGCDHITSLRVESYKCKCKEYSALAACIRGSTALTEVDIDMIPRHGLSTSPELRSVEGELVSALASNIKLVRVSLKGLQLSYDDLNVLARGASRSLSLTEFTVSPHCILYKRCDRETCPVHVTEPFLEGSDHKDGALADILEVAKKNASAVLNAADFVLGEQNGVEGARAIELMRDHPRLLEMLMEDDDVTKAEAKEMIRSALLRVRSSSIDQFMRMTGVVKEAVQCLSQPGARRLQLADIGHDCWLHIRSFLKIADVVSR